MSPAVAARVWVLTERIIKGVKSANESAAAVLKEHFRKTGATTYRGIGYSSSPTSRLDAALAREALGPKKTIACTKPGTRESLSLPTTATPIVPDELVELTGP